MSFAFVADVASHHNWGTELDARPTGAQVGTGIELEPRLDSEQARDLTNKALNRAFFLQACFLLNRLFKGSLLASTLRIRGNKEPYFPPLLLRPDLATLLRTMLQDPQVQEFCGRLTPQQLDEIVLTRAKESRIDKKLSIEKGVYTINGKTVSPAALEAIKQTAQAIIAQVHEVTPSPLGQVTDSPPSSAEHHPLTLAARLELMALRYRIEAAHHNASLLEKRQAQATDAEVRLAAAQQRVNELSAQVSDLEQRHATLTGDTAAVTALSQASRDELARIEPKLMQAREALEALVRTVAEQQRAADDLARTVEERTAVVGRLSDETVALSQHRDQLRQHIAELESRRDPARRDRCNQLLDELFETNHLLELVATDLDQHGLFRRLFNSDVRKEYAKNKQLQQQLFHRRSSIYAELQKDFHDFFSPEEVHDNNFFDARASDRALTMPVTDDNLIRLPDAKKQINKAGTSSPPPERQVV